MSRRLHHSPLDEIPSGTHNFQILHIPSRSTTYALTLVSKGSCLVLPSRLSGDGASFSVLTPAQPLVVLPKHFEPVRSLSTELSRRARPFCH